MSTFHFKRFSVVNERSAMKVNTDGVLLGASMTVSSSDTRLLDVGTGTGVIALMAAQRMSGMTEQFLVDAIDIDQISVQEASFNFSSSPWSDKLHVEHCSLAEFHPVCSYDRIFSNPPYFDNSLTNPDLRKMSARHTDSLSFRELFEFAHRYLDRKGSFSLILPYQDRQRLLREGRFYGMFPFRVIEIRTTPLKAPKRLIAEFSFERKEEIESLELAVQAGGQYSSQYMQLVKDFYLFA